MSPTLNIHHLNMIDYLLELQIKLNLQDIVYVE